MHLIRRAALSAPFVASRSVACGSFSKVTTHPLGPLEKHALRTLPRAQSHISVFRSYATDQTQSPEDTQAGESQGHEKEDSSPLESAAHSVKETASGVAQKARDTVSDAAATVTPDSPASTAQTTPIHNEATSGSENTGDSKTLYVGNLYFEVSTEQLRSEFEKHGQVTSAKIVCDNRGLSKGYGFLDFSSAEEATKAQQALHEQILEGRQLSVQKTNRQEVKPRGPGEFGPQNPPSKTLFIGNMSYDMSDKDLNELFREIKNVLDVRVAIDRRTGQPRGFAHADFLDVSSAEKAAEYLKTKTFHGRTLRVDFSMSKVRT